VNPPDNAHDPQIAVTAAHATPAAPTQCDECAAPVDEEQRYCVVCGAHRRHVEDPAARYLSELTAKARTSRAAAVARPVRRAPVRGRGLGLAVALALVPVAAAVGVVAERSSGNGDAKLIQALAHEQAAADAASAGTATSATSTTGGAAASDDSGSARHAGATKASHHVGAKKRTGHKRSGAASSSIPGGTAISQNPTQAQKNTGAKVTEKVQKSTGKSYVNGQSGLPGTVVVP
jgi:hypothetical protein